MSGPVDQGQTYRYRHVVKDSAGVLANAGSVVVTITLPDGTLATPTVVNSGTGLYDIAYTTTQVGLHNLRGTVTGGTLGTEVDVWEDAFVVEQPARLFIGLDDASNHLRAQGIISTDADREQLRWLCIVACAAVEADLDLAIAKRTVVETFDGGWGYELDLGTKPPRQSDGGSVSVTTVVESGVTLTGCVVRKDRWTLLRGDPATRWTFGYENITVTYVAGCASPPPVARAVAMNVVQTTWQASQQADHPFLDEVARRASLATLSTSVLPSLSGVQQSAYRALRLRPTNAA